MEHIARDIKEQGIILSHAPSTLFREDFRHPFKLREGAENMGIGITDDSEG